MTEPIRKAFSAVSKAIDIELGIFEAMISTEDVDRQGDIVRATGAKLENYLKNPVVLWAHDYDEPPVAKALGIEIMQGIGLRARFQFPEWGVNPEADTIRRLWAGGFLNATSIGFMPLTSKPVDSKNTDTYYWGPWDYTSWELLEFSIVPVPTNQSALRLALRSLSHPRAETKKGRVLSAANENKLKQARDAIDAVLTQIAEDEQQQESHQDGSRKAVKTAKEEGELQENQSEPGSGDGTPAPVNEPEQTQPNIDPTSNDVDEATLAALSELINQLNGA